ncbi:MAG: hypothetical protein AAF772_02700 [Acidobacteriota bacterium]
MTLRASAPGKLILSGEHAAVYGHPALVATIDRRLDVALERLSAPPTGASAVDAVLLELPDLTPTPIVTSWTALRDAARAARDRWRAYRDDPATGSIADVRAGAGVVELACGEALLHLEARGGAPVVGRPARLRVTSQIPVGGGFGSSAAAATATAAAVLHALAPDRPWSSDDAGRAAIADVALEAERRQHGAPSGVDGATVLHGGLLWAVPASDASGAIGRPTRTPLRPSMAQLARFRVYDTGPPAESTGEVVAAVAARRRAAPAQVDATLDVIADATRTLRDRLCDADADADDTAPDPQVIAAVRRVHGALCALGAVPEAVRRCATEIETRGGAAKISGAGSILGPGAGALLVYDRGPTRARADRIHEAVDPTDAIASLQPLEVRLGGDGLRFDRGS